MKPRASKSKIGGVDRVRKRWVLLWAQGCICPACGGLLNPQASAQAKDYPTLDHMDTYGRGGAHALSNLLVKHRYCNEARGDKLATARDRDALALVASRLESRPLTIAECEQAVQAIFAVHLAARVHQPNASRWRGIAA